MKRHPLELFKKDHEETHREDHQKARQNFERGAHALKRSYWIQIWTDA